MKVIKANHLGMCFGVRDAIQLATEQSAAQPLTILGDLVHNETVLEQLRHRGIRIESNLNAINTPGVMVTAHGASEKSMAAARARGHTVIEATCPLVKLAHRAVADFVRLGCHPVIVGKRDHVEVRGMTEDLPDFDVILNEADVDTLAPRARFGIAAQTTQPIAKVRQLARLIQTRFPDSEVRFADTVCQPTKHRQTSAVEVARQSDVVIVIGGLGSNNTRELVTTCREYCSKVHHVQTAADLQPEWFAPDDRVGLTAGTSTPDVIINGVEAWLNRFANSQKVCEVNQ